MRLPPALLFAVYLVALAVATLWPFNFFQPNLATFVPQGGLAFVPPSIAYTETPPAKLAQVDSFTIIIRLSGSRGRRSGCVLDYATREGRVNLRMEQHDDQLLFWAASPEATVGAGLRLGRVFGSPDTVTAVFSFDGTMLNGWDTHGTSSTTGFARASHLHWDPAASLTFGSLVDGKVGWRGTLYSFAVLNRPLVPGTTPGLDSLLAMNGLILSYDLRKGSGRTVLDGGVSPPAPLSIPEQYTLPQREILTFDYSPWRRRWFDRDILVNVVGFLPFGFFAMMILRGKPHKTLALILAAATAGLFCSLTIELLQAFLPSRTSSIIDVMSNTAGTLLGTWLAGLDWPFSVLHRVGIQVASQQQGKVAE